MKKNNSGSVTIMAVVIMLFISLYGSIILGNSTRKYNNQTNSIETIVNAYRFQGGNNSSSGGKKITIQELQHLYENVGGTVIEY